MEDTITNCITPADICDSKSESIVKDEPKGDVEIGSETGGCFDVLDMVEEPFDEAVANYFSSDEEADKMYSNCDSSSESDSPDRTLQAEAADTYAADSQSAEADDYEDLEEVFETVDGDPNDYEECYVAERPPSPPDNPLPRGWKQVYHESGATIYVHLETNVCSLSRPYFLGTNSTKQHKLPTTPVPCLRYRFCQQNKNEDVAESAATVGSTTSDGNASPSAVGPVTDPNASICPASSYASVNSDIPDASAATSDSNTTISDANAVTSSENPTIPTENLSYSDINLCSSPVRLITCTENIPNDANALASDADSIQVVAADLTTNAGVISSIISDSSVSPVCAASLAESAVTSCTDTAIFAQNLDPSDVIMADMSEAVPDRETAESAVISGTDTAIFAQNFDTSDVIMTDASVAVPDGKTATSNTDATIPDSHTDNQMIISDENVSTSTSTSNNCDAMISVELAPSTSAALKSTRNDTIVADTAKGEEAQLLDYCKRLFKFKKIKYLKFRSWDVRRTYLRTLRNERNRRRCPFSNNKFVSFPIETKDDEGNVVATKKWIINPRGRSYVAILHEYLQQSKKTQPDYKFTEVDNARNPYAATVVVNGTEYGTGFGMSKKEAKFEAAKATLEVLLPKMMKYVLSVCCDKTGNKDDCSDNEDDLQNVASAFDDIEITDPRVTELSLQTTEPKPYELLLNCLQKKGEQPDVKFDFQAESMESTMKVGESQVTVKCGNKREGKQLAAQAMLQLLHPHIKNWGSLLRLYGNYITNQYRQVSDDKDVEELKCKPANQELLDTLRRRMTTLTDANEVTSGSSERR